ncbi:uncharacterized protein LOC129944009 [Eupeodes corollae]|uniref:uncharacterized protein LOC129944009 n=1 Tax=Eupeodes corollae TaxID=290404 RepID=UPI002492D706|nr:uncharacterized protein LOC129944009 [Eupeodes corollae]
MLKFVALFCIISAAKAGILSPALSIGAVAPATTILSAPTVLRTAPIAVATTTDIRAPIGISSGLISNGLISGGLISNGIVSGGLVAKSGLISGGIIGGGKLLI